MWGGGQTISIALPPKIAVPERSPLLHETPRRTEKRQMPADRPAVTRMLGAVWAPGLGLAFSSIGFGAITTFVPLLFVTRGWSPAWLAFTAFADRLHRSARGLRPPAG